MRVKKPRVPWGRRPRRHTGLNLISCGKKRITSKATFTAQFTAAWLKKNCGPRGRTREFNAGGPEAGTLAGARRAEGLFDYNWGTPFPLTRDEQRKLQDGLKVPNPFFEPPTSPVPSSFIADKLALAKRQFGRTEYAVASELSQLCGTGGSGITCEGPDGGIKWTSTTAQLTPQDMARFREAYCGPEKCQAPGAATPPPGFKESVIKGRPAHPGTKRRVKCTPEPTADVNGPKLEKLPPLNGPEPNAEATPAGCVPDIILGFDAGPFASGWAIVDRRGTRLLVPNPLTCPAPRP